MPKFVMRDGRVAVEEDDGTIRPLRANEVKKLKVQMGQFAASKQRKKNNAG